MATLLEKEYATDTLFNLETNLQDYHRLVGEKYQNSTAVLESYDKPSEIYESKPSAMYSAKGFGELQTYDTAPIKRETAFIPVELESYVSKPTPSTTTTETFRPKIFDTDMADIDFTNAGLPSKSERLSTSADYSLIEDTKESVAQDTAPETTTAFETKFKLNGVGMVAVISFIAVTVMIFAFVIANGISIGTNSAKIGALESVHATATAELATATANNQAFLNEYQQWYMSENGITGVTFNEYLTMQGYTTVPTIEMNQTNWTPATEPKSSGGVFDWISKLFSKLF